MVRNTRPDEATKPDVLDIRTFLATHPPFAALPDTVLDRLPAQVRTMRVTAGTAVLRMREHVQWLYVVRVGRIAIQGTGGDIWAERIEGESFGVQALLTDGRSSFDATAIEDTTLYLLPDTVFARLKSEHLELERYFVPLGGTGRQPPHAFDGLSTDVQTNLIALRVRDVMTPDPLTIGSERPVCEAAALMRERNVSCLPVLASGELASGELAGGELAGGELAGMISDVELRNNVVAENRPAQTPVATVMAGEPHCLPADSLACDAVSAMREHGVRHLPVTQRGRLVGVVTETDIRRRQDDNFGDLGTLLMRRQTPASLAQVVARVPQTLVTLVETGVPALRVGMILSSVTDTTTYRLLQQAEAWLGPPPVPYVWVCGGSQARQEQTAITDQDNFLILDDRYEEAAHGSYFDDLTRFVCDGLDGCGYEYCPGEMMAMTPKWRQPLATWIRYFTSWIEEPVPMAQMLSSVMFDLRPVRGDVSLFDRLQDFTAEKARQNSVFLAHLAGNALTHMPPLGMFRRFVLSRDRDHGQHLDLKLHGTVPIIDLARVYALKAGIKTANTHDRLVEAHRAGVLSESGMHDLIDAFEFIASVRLKHQSRCILRGQPPDAFVTPGELSRIERHRLRNAFAAVKALQSTLASTYRVER